LGGTPIVNWPKFHELILLQNSGKSEEALAGFEQLLADTESREDRAAVLLAIAACLRSLLRPGDARRYLHQAEAAAPRKSEVYGWILFSESRLDIDAGDWRSALNTMDALLKAFSAMFHRPENRDDLNTILRNRGIALLGLDRPMEARSLLEDSLARNDTEMETVQYCLGKCCYKLDDFVAAAFHLERALEKNLDPAYKADAHYHLGLAYQRQDQFARAIEQFTWCLEHDVEHQVPHKYVLRALRNAYDGLGLDAEVSRYDTILRDL
jgi:tetratricopeptide (TPR) repeat protein